MGRALTDRDELGVEGWAESRDEQGRRWVCGPVTQVPAAGQAGEGAED